MKEKKIPQRLCLGCNEMVPKKELIRVVRSKEGEVSLDLTGKKPGRGAYIHPRKSCLDKAFKSKRLNKNLSTNIDEAMIQAMQELVKDE